jgi:hypothetical protein
MGKPCSTNWRGEEESMQDIVGKARRKEPLRRPRRTWVDNITMVLTRDRMGWYGLDRSGSG